MSISNLSSQMRIHAHPPAHAIDLVVISWKIGKCQILLQVTTATPVSSVSKFRSQPSRSGPNIRLTCSLAISYIKRCLSFSTPFSPIHLKYSAPPNVRSYGYRPHTEVGSVSECNSQKKGRVGPKIRWTRTSHEPKNMPETPPLEVGCTQ